MVGAQRGYLLRELHNLEGLRVAHEGEIVVKLLLSAAVRHVTADLDFLDDAEHSLSERGPGGADGARPRR